MLHISMLSHTPIINSELKSKKWKYMIFKEVTAIFCTIFSMITLGVFIGYALAPTTSCNSVDLTITNITVITLNNTDSPQYEGNLTATYNSMFCNILVPDSLSSSYQNTTNYMNQYHINNSTTACQYIDNNNVLNCSFSSYSKDKPAILEGVCYVFAILALCMFIISQLSSCKEKYYAKQLGEYDQYNRY